MGTQSATELRIKHEQIELMAKASRTLLETQAAMLEIKAGDSREEQDATATGAAAQLGEKSSPPGLRRWQACIRRRLPPSRRRPRQGASGTAELLAPESERNSNSSTRHLATFRAMSGLRPC